MFTLPKQETVRRIPAQIAKAPVNIAPGPKGLANPVKPVPVPVSSSGSGVIPTATPPVLSLPPGMPVIGPVIGDPIPQGAQFILPPPPPQQAPPVPLVANVDPVKMSFLSGLGGIVGGIGGFLTGGVGGAVTGFQAGEKLLGGGSPSAPNLPVLAGRTGGIVQGTQGINMPFKVLGPGGQPLPGFNPGGGTAVRGHYKKNGQWSNRRRPRMNPMNVRAGRRAATRLHAAEKLFRRFLTVSHPGKPHGRIAPKGRKRLHA